MAYLKLGDYQWQIIDFEKCSNLNNHIPSLRKKLSIAKLGFTAAKKLETGQRYDMWWEQDSTC